jgi:hypothetical protein
VDEIDKRAECSEEGPGAKMSIATRMGGYVQYGFGLCAPAGWLNFDASARLRLAMFAQVEDVNRFVDHGHQELAVEAIKPSEHRHVIKK